jgi:hypothetical protein
LRRRQLDPRHLLARGEIHHREAVGVGELHEDALGRAVGAGLDRHRAHAEIERQLPDRDLALEIDDGHELAGIEPVIRCLPSGVT